MALKDEIRLRRENMNLSLSGFARLSGINKSILSRWENGKRQPSIEGLMKLAKCFGVTETELLHPKAENEENEDSKNVQ